MGVTTRGEERGAKDGMRGERTVEGSLVGNVID